MLSHISIDQVGRFYIYDVICVYNDTTLDAEVL
jgi:hypothetical protein